MTAKRLRAPSLLSKGAPAAPEDWTKLPWWRDNRALLRVVREAAVRDAEFAREVVLMLGALARGNKRLRLEFEEVAKLSSAGRQPTRTHELMMLLDTYEDLRSGPAPMSAAAAHAWLGEFSARAFDKPRSAKSIERLLTEARSLRPSKPPPSS